MKIRWILVLLYASLTCSAQSPDSLRLRTEVYHSSQWEFGSNGIHTKSLFSYLSTQQLDKRLKEDLISRLQAENVLGNIQDVEFGFRQERDSIHGRWKRGFGLHLAHRSRWAMNASDRVYELVFFGNARFAGQYIDLMPLDLKALQWSEVGYSFWQETNDLSWSVSTNLLFGHAMQELEVERGSIFTEESGEFIDVQTQYRFRSADSLLLFKGMGASVHLESSYDPDGPWRFRLGVRDLGLIGFGRSSWEVRADSSFRFEGEEIPNLFDETTNLLNSARDRLEATFYDAKGGTQWVLLPARLRAEMGYGLSHPFLKEVQWLGDHLFLPGYRFRNRVRLKMKMSRQWTLRPELSHGGLARFGFGIGAQWKNSSWRCALELNNAQWMVAPASFGLGGQFSIRYLL